MENNTSKVHAGPAGPRFSEALLGPDGAPVSGSALFVINLCTSIAPATTAGKVIPGLESYRLYQVAHCEDGRTRHRLRLGFFTSQEDADQALAMVRDSYPTAFTTSLSDDDRRFARSFQPDTAASGRRPAPPVTLVEKMTAPAAQETSKQASKQAVSPSASAMAARGAALVTSTPKIAAPESPPALATAKETTPAAPATAHASKAAGPATATTAPAATSTSAITGAHKAASSMAPASKTTLATPANAAATTALASPAKQISVESQSGTASTKAALVMELTLASEPAASSQEPVVTTRSEPFHVGKGVDIPAISLTLEAAAPPSHEPVDVQPTTKRSPAATASQAAQKPAAATVKAASLPPAAVPAHDAMRTVPPIPRSARDPSRPPPELDSTQTIRALTSAELNDDSQEKWFAIQLAASDQPVNLDAMPHLDIFEAYRLYSVANAGSGKIVHSLRIGFFREQVSAEAVAGYLKTFFAAPSVLRISAAEQLRFKDAPSHRAANVRSEAKVVEFSQARERAKAIIPTVTMEVPTPARSTDPGSTGSFNATASGSFKTVSTGSHKALKQAAKSAVAAKRSSAKVASSGRYKALPKKSLNEQLLDEARQVALSESAIRRLPKNHSLLSRLVGKLTK